jgi:hypothetical protein
MFRYVSILALSLIMASSYAVAIVHAGPESSSFAGVDWNDDLPQILDKIDRIQDFHKGKKDQRKSTYLACLDNRKYPPDVLERLGKKGPVTIQIWCYPSIGHTWFNNVNITWSKYENKVIRISVSIKSEDKYWKRIQGVLEKKYGKPTKVASSRSSVEDDLTWILPHQDIYLFWVKGSSGIAVQYDIKQNLAKHCKEEKIRMRNLMKGVAESSEKVF